MALACLLKNVPEMYKDLPVVPVAFIVDHNARPGSDKEANFVKACLSDYGKRDLPLALLSAYKFRN